MGGGGGGRVDDLSVLLITAPGAATIAPLLYILITHQWGAVVIKSFYIEINIAIDTFLNQTKTMAYLTVNELGFCMVLETWILDENLGFILM